MSNIKIIDSSYKKRIKKILLGNSHEQGLLAKIIIYIVLLSIGYIFLLPIFKMLSNSFKSLEDLLSPMVNWIPRKLYFGNYKSAFKTLNYFNTLGVSLLVTLIPAVFQTITCSFVGYGLANFKFKGKKIIFGLLLFTYVLPISSVMIPRYLLFQKINIVNTIWSINLPAILGQGLYSSIFIYIFYFFFRNIPKSLYEAAYIDGANRFEIFLKISIPLVVPGFITTFLFSFVWYWNETYLASMFLGNTKYITLQLALITFDSSFVSGGLGNINEAIKSAATILVILPLLIVYMILQRYFIEGIENTGLAGGE